MCMHFNTHPAHHDYCCFSFVLLVDQITVIGKERFEIFVLRLNKYMGNFLPLEVVGHGSETQLKWVKILIS